MRETEKKESIKLPAVFCTEDLLSKIGGNFFQLVRIASARALELDAGKPPLISDIYTDKVTTIALEEIIQGKVVYKYKGIKEGKIKT